MASRKSSLMLPVIIQTMRVPCDRIDLLAL